MGKWLQESWKEIGLFSVGSFILLWQTVYEGQHDPVVIGAGVTLCTLSAGSVVVKAVKNGNGNGGGKT